MADQECKVTEVIDQSTLEEKATSARLQRWKSVLTRHAYLCGLTVEELEGILQHVGLYNWRSIAVYGALEFDSEASLDQVDETFSFRQKRKRTTSDELLNLEPSFKRFLDRLCEALRSIFEPQSADMIEKEHHIDDVMAGLSKIILVKEHRGEQRSVFKLKSGAEVALRGLLHEATVLENEVRSSVRESLELAHADLQMTRNNKAMRLTSPRFSSRDDSQVLVSKILSKTEAAIQRYIHDPSRSLEISKMVSKWKEGRDYTIHIKADLEKHSSGYKVFVRCKCGSELQVTLKRSKGGGLPTIGPSSFKNHLYGIYEGISAPRCSLVRKDLA